MGRADGAGVAAALRISVAFSPAAGIVDEIALQLAPGACVEAALIASALQTRHPQVDLAALAVGIWGLPCTRSTLLRDGDRVELYRPLAVDPKEARRRRDAVQRAAKRGVARPAR